MGLGVVKFGLPVIAVTIWRPNWILSDTDMPSRPSFIVLIWLCLSCGRKKYIPLPRAFFCGELRLNPEDSTIRFKQHARHAPSLTGRHRICLPCANGAKPCKSTRAKNATERKLPLKSDKREKAVKNLPELYLSIGRKCRL